MSFWSFMGELALFNLISKWFSGKPKNSSQWSHQNNNFIGSTGYDARMDEWQRETDRIDELEGLLDDCDVDSDRYDEIIDELDALEEHVDGLESELNMYDDMCDDMFVYGGGGSVSSGFDGFDDDW